MKKSHIARGKKRASCFTQGMPPKSPGKSNTRATLKRERVMLFKLNGDRTRHHVGCLSCLLDCSVLRKIDRSYAATINREAGNDMARAREMSVVRDIIDRGNEDAMYTFETCPKIGKNENEKKEPTDSELTIRELAKKHSVSALYIMRMKKGDQNDRKASPEELAELALIIDKPFGRQ